MLPEQIERPREVDPAQEAEAPEPRLVVSLFQRGLQVRLEHPPGQARDSSTGIGGGRDSRVRSGGSLRRARADRPLLGFLGRNARPALKPEALGLDQDVGPGRKVPFQQEPALGIRRGRGLARREKDPRTGNRLTLAVVDQPDQFAALLKWKPKRWNGRQLGLCRQRVGADDRGTLRTDHDPVGPAGHELRRRLERAIGPRADRPRIEVNETARARWLRILVRIRPPCRPCSPPRPRPGRSPSAGPRRW